MIMNPESRRPDVSVIGSVVAVRLRLRDGTDPAVKCYQDVTVSEN